MLTSVFSASLEISGSFYSEFVFVCTYVVDAIIILGSQLLVATTYIEKEFLGRSVTMKSAIIMTHTHMIPRNVPSLRA